MAGSKVQLMKKAAIDTSKVLLEAYGNLNVLSLVDLRICTPQDMI